MEKNDIDSAIKTCNNILADVTAILARLPTNDLELPTWWFNKLAACCAYTDSLRDCINYEVEESAEEAVEEAADVEETDVEEIEDDAMLPPSVRLMRNVS
jgi:U3 small nucleolar ribonucleoprotein component